MKHWSSRAYLTYDVRHGGENHLAHAYRKNRDKGVHPQQRPRERRQRKHDGRKQSQVFADNDNLYARGSNYRVFANVTASYDLSLIHI